MKFALIVAVVVTLFNLEHVSERGGSSRGWSSGGSGGGSWSSGGGGHK
ncbi:hypothetical protein [Zoogloea dura]|uniref:Uncharacterized protein n=1 Tax=Zoogloea dura TaxID=2728840 RepID=A0A848G8U2_9RHOO|nr:hypothetical protein [Zoogloea dura]NML27266.1 hypothetical protein [Zoogloea dura]